MQQIISLWTNLEPRRRITVILATVAMFAAVLLLARMAAQPSMSLLYSGLENGQAGEIVRALDQRGVTYEVRGGSIYVDGRDRDALRMTLASEGLPRNSSQGYELLDSLSGFGMTSQMFDAAYWRAKEGELARTIASSPQIEAARVHIAHQGATPFQRDVKPTASIALTTSGDISASQAKALRYLVASAVAGLNPDDVAVIDDKGELLSLADDPSADTAATDRAQALKEKVQRLLEARVGAGNAVVEVTVETVTESESIHERRFDPDGRVAISTDTEESSNSAQNSDAGNVTVASNLPNGAGGGNNSSNSQGNETRERVNYEVSEVNREVLRAPGAVRRMTVAVLVNGVGTQGADGTTTLAVRGDEELASLRELVSSAVGYDDSRGDVITIKSMVFEPVTLLGTASDGGFAAGLNLDVMSLIQMAVLALVALVLGLFVIKPVLSGGVARVPLLESGGGGGSAGESLPALDGEIDGDEDYALPDLSMGSGFGGGNEGGGFPMIADFDGMGGGSAMDSDDPVARLQSLIEERKDETMEILRSWLEESGETA
ncbi:flagellar M-ring protein FliF [Pseudooceanicola sp. CBS1P-1]|uniref:Flagellar M-ring protein n=1 Tax=Pseudooceanicola albus TaxID=2692189 RepID=A0A6L7G8Y7_9RHOB|nr:MULTISPECIES: flagellar basal-body MS-ring/collar protein FliF [Pseudooceanicola]MBT9385871.1 flagellar M-ring protein FliF [Pseudooceanicola endophyticus]MXN20102.1 flagellar M-ring protein FliF [Pseudooceanicola albus]